MSELDRWAAIPDGERRTLFEFCEANGISDSAIYEFYGVNVVQLEKERAELLRKVQEANK